MMGKNESFKSKAAVLRWLDANGYKIAKSAFYDHCREGKLRPNKDSGNYTMSAVKKYAKTWVPLASTGQKQNDAMSAKQEQKLDLELQRESVRVERETLELSIKQGKHVKREDHELSIVGRGTAFMAHLTHSVHESANDWIDLVDGDQSKADLFVAAVVEELTSRMSDFTADIELDVILEANI